MKNKYKVSSVQNSICDNNVQRQIDLADFEEAISSAGYGKFNILVLLTLVPAGCATSFSALTMSYVFPIAQCDLNLSMEDKGMLNSISFLGMIASGFLFGYLTDALGRRKIIVYLYFVDGILVVLSSLSQQYIPLLILKFLNGFVTTGGQAAYLSYGNEFHGCKYRPFVALYNAIMMNSAATFAPFLAWLIFSDKINISLFDGYIVLRSWNIFLLVCSIPSFLASLIFLMMPESPKFLMTMGKNKEALEVFRQVYSVNCGLSADTYPVKSLIEERHQNNAEEAPRTFRQQLIDGWHQTKLLFCAPYNTKIVLVVVIYFGYLIGLNTLRLWFPQLLVAIYDNDSLDKLKEFDLCSGLQTLTDVDVDVNSTCSVNYNKSVYIYVIICGATIIAILLISLTMFRTVSRKILMISGCVSGISCIMIYFSQNLPMLLILYSVHIALVYIATNFIHAVVVNIFPTFLRALSISVTFIFGRIGSVIGHTVFPHLLAAGCPYPFMAIGAFVIVASLLTLLLPNTENVSLQ